MTFVSAGTMILLSAGTVITRVGGSITRAGGAWITFTSFTTASSSTTAVTPDRVLDQVDRPRLGGLVDHRASQVDRPVRLDDQLQGGADELLVPLDALGDAGEQFPLLGGDLPAGDPVLDAAADVLAGIVQRLAGTLDRPLIGVRRRGEHDDGEQGGGEFAGHRLGSVQRMSGVRHAARVWPWHRAMLEQCVCRTRGRMSHASCRSSRDVHEHEC